MKVKVPFSFKSNTRLDRNTESAVYYYTGHREISSRLGQKGFHDVELLFYCGVILFCKFDHCPSDQADFPKYIFNNVEYFPLIAHSSRMIAIVERNET